MNLEYKIENNLSEERKNAIFLSANIAEAFNVSIYLIGGVVRDLIMDNTIKDIDIAVEGDAIEFAKFLESKTNCKIVSLQDDLKTAKVVFENKIEIDFASTREEHYLSSGTLPIVDNFGCSLILDIKRRDFTINTMAVRLTGYDKYSLIDYYGGYSDIGNKKIQVLHDDSFVDDPSRIIRALKFKERFNFSLDRHTYELMSDYLKSPNFGMPLERIKSELKQYFSINKNNLYDEIIKTNAYKLVSDNPVPYINIENLNKIKQFNLFDTDGLSLIYILCLIINSDLTSSKFNVTAYEKKVLNEVKEMLNFNLSENDDETIYRRYNGKENLSLAMFYMFSGDDGVIKYLSELKQIKVFLTGSDLINLGLKPSRYFSEIFEILLSEKIKGKIKTKEDEFDFVKKMIKKES